MKRSHHCSQLRKDNAGSPATLIGWIDSLRDHGGVFFLDLRDREGKTQVVLDPENQTLSELFPKLKPESVIEVTGEVRNREEGTENSKLATGDIELFANSILVHNQSKTPPFPMDDTADKVGEDLRLTYRYLDLRRKSNWALLNFAIVLLWQFVIISTSKTSLKSRPPCFLKAPQKELENF